MSRFRKKRRENIGVCERAIRRVIIPASRHFPRVVRRDHAGDERNTLGRHAYFAPFLALLLPMLPPDVRVACEADIRL